MIRAILMWLLHAVAYVFAAFGLLIVIAEWFVGCGETYVDAKGERHQYECLFIPQQPVESK